MKLPSGTGPEVRADPRSGAEALRRARGTDGKQGFSQRRLAGWLMRTHWFTRKVVTEKWFLHQEVPPLQKAV